MLTRQKNRGLGTANLPPEVSRHSPGVGRHSPKGRLVAAEAFVFSHRDGDEAEAAMNARTITATVAGMVGVGAAATAALAIRLVLTSPTIVAGMMDGTDGPFHAVARALYETLAHIVRSL
jgi:hypothetical protein